MARTRTFEVDEVLERAMQLFWQKGYGASTLRGITAATGLSKSSLYETFGSKQGLFLEALDRYAAATTALYASVLAGEGQARDRVRRLFDMVIQETMDDERRRGCFLVNCATEVAAHDVAVCRRVVAAFGRIEAAFAGCVRDGQKAGEIPVPIDATEAGRFLTATLNGIRVAARTGADERMLGDIARVALSALD